MWQLHDPVAMHRPCGAAVICVKREHSGSSASLDAPKIGKPKKRVSWRAGSLDDVAQASSDRAGLATPEELAQLGQPEQFTWKVRLFFFLYRRQAVSTNWLRPAPERCN